MFAILYIENKWIKKSFIKQYNSRGGHMTKKELWNLFKITGKIEYYLKYKEKDRRG